jgi:hypothetical protein
LTQEEVQECYERRGYEDVQAGEKWFTFEHSGQWREVERQFMGAVRSHGMFEPPYLSSTKKLSHRP